MSAPIAYLNGRFLPQSEASLPLHDAGFVMGATVTDFCRTFNRVLFRWPDHLARFRRDCDACFIPLMPPDEELTAIAEVLISDNGKLLSSGQELALITFATPGSIGYYLGEMGGAGDGPATLGMHTFPLPIQRYRRFFEEGVSLALVRYISGDNDSLVPPRIKHRSRLQWWLADKSLRNSPFASPHALPLLIDSRDGDGMVAETAIGNVVVVANGIVLSPRRETILDGISLGYVEKLSHALGILFREHDIRVSDLCVADEVLLCGTAFGLAGVSSIDRWSVPWPGPVFTRLLNAWSERVGLDIARQFLPNP